MPKAPFTPRPGHVVQVVAVGEFSSHAGDPKALTVVGEVRECGPSLLGKDWVSIVLDCAGRVWVCEQCRVAIAPSRREVA